jgi:type I site-specific restriction-modification system R (restriction) subunit
MDYFAADGDEDADLYSEDEQEMEVNESSAELGARLAVVELEGDRLCHELARFTNSGTAMERKMAVEELLRLLESFDGIMLGENKDLRERRRNAVTKIESLMESIQSELNRESQDVILTPCPSESSTEGMGTQLHSPIEHRQAPLPREPAQPSWLRFENMEYNPEESFDDDDEDEDESTIAHRMTLLPEREFELAKAEEEEMSEILRKEEEEKKRIREEVERKRNEREEQLRKREEERKAQQDREDAERKSRIAELQTIHAKTPAKKRTQKASKGGLKRAKKEEDLSEYERIREENIKEREQLMAQLGVTPISSLSTPSKRAPKRVQNAESPLAPKT